MRLYGDELETVKAALEVAVDVWRQTAQDPAWAKYSAKYAELVAAASRLIERIEESQ